MYAYLEQAVGKYNRTLESNMENKRRSRYIPADVKGQVWAKCKGQCMYCGLRHCLDYDHIVPYSKGGPNTVDNLQLLCRDCNVRKGARL